MKKFTLLLSLLICTTVMYAQNTFPDTGYVGIGTTSPELHLDINSPDGDASIGLGEITISNTDGGIGIGTSILTNNTSGYANIGIGTGILASNTSGFDNIGIGRGVLASNIDGNYNIGIGLDALSENITGTYNVALGLDALKYNKGGDYNIAIGLFSMIYCATGSSNVAIGSYSLYSNKKGEDNVSIGSNSMVNNIIGNDNTAVGAGTLNKNTKGEYNTAIGRSSLFSNTLGNSNTGVGRNTLQNNKTGSYNSAVGFSAESTENNFDNLSAIGYDVLVDASNKIVLGNASVSSIGGEVDWTVYSDARIKEQVEENVPGLAFIKQLRPVTYHYNITKQNQIMGRIDTAQWTGKYDIEQMAFSGFIAQEVAAAAEGLGYAFSGVDESGRLMGLRYATFVVPLVQAVQELDAENTIKDTKIESLESRIAQLEKLITKQGIVLRDETTEEIYKQSAIIENETGVATLSQNVPNPFTGNTSIAYYVPETAQQAHIKIANANGTSLFMADVRLGNGVLDVDASQLTAGSYSYTLLVDGKVVDTKLMVIQ